MKVLLSVIIFFLCIQSSDAKDKTKWYSGKILLENESEIAGEISYNYKHGVIMLKDEDGTTKAFSAKQTQYFEYFDEVMQVPRRYISLPFFTGKSYSNKMFFELIMDGEISVFRKEKKNINLEFIQQHDNDNFTRYHASFDYYFFNDGSFISLKEFPDKLYPKLSTGFPNKIEEFISDNSLNVASGIHAILVIDFYNSLVDATYSNLDLAQSFNVE